MKKISRNILVLAGLMLSVACLAGISVAPTVNARPVEHEQRQGVEQPKNPYENSTILVEAFVAEVKLDMLYRSGVSPIGQKPNSVSIKNILQCLKLKDSGKISAGAKVAVKQGDAGSTQVEQRVYLERLEQQRPGRGSKAGEAGVRKVFDSYTVGKQLNADVAVKPDGRIWVRFAFAQNALGNVPSEKDRPPDIVKRNWSGVVSLEAGRPSIVGATQNEQIAVFLILCADIENE